MGQAKIGTWIQTDRNWEREINTAFPNWMFCILADAFGNLLAWLTALPGLRATRCQCSTKHEGMAKGLCSSLNCPAGERLLALSAERERRRGQEMAREMRSHLWACSTGRQAGAGIQQGLCGDKRLSVPAGAGTAAPVFLYSTTPWAGPAPSAPLSMLVAANSSCYWQNCGLFPNRIELEFQ